MRNRWIALLLSIPLAAGCQEPGGPQSQPNVQVVPDQYVQYMRSDGAAFANCLAVNFPDLVSPPGTNPSRCSSTIVAFEGRGSETVPYKDDRRIIAYAPSSSLNFYFRQRSHHRKSEYAPQDLGGGITRFRGQRHGQYIDSGQEIIASDFETRRSDIHCRSINILSDRTPMIACFLRAGETLYRISGPEADIHALVAELERIPVKAARKGKANE